MPDKPKSDKDFFVGDEISPNAAQKPPPEAPPVPNGVKVRSVEVAGVIHDSEGHTWTIPEKDETDVHYHSKFEIPNPDPLMSYQFIRKEELTEMMGEQWMPCTREEIGVAVFKTEKDEYGDPLDRYHVVGMQICVKKPKVLVDRQYAAQKRVCDAAVAATEPPPPGKDLDEQKVRTGAQYHKGGRRYEQSRKTETVSPKNAANEQVAATE